MDHSARGSMKTAASCALLCESQEYQIHRQVERTLRRRHSHVLPSLLHEGRTSYNHTSALSPTTGGGCLVTLTALGRRYCLVLQRRRCALKLCLRVAALKWGRGLGIRTTAFQPEYVNHGSDLRRLRVTGCVCQRAVHTYLLCCLSTLVSRLVRR